MRDDFIMCESAMKCRHCGKFSHTEKEGQECRDKEFLDMSVEISKLQKENDELKASEIKEREAKDFELLINRALTIKNKELLFEVKELKLSLEKAEKEIISRGDNFNRVKEENEILRLVVEKLKKELGEKNK